MEQAVKDAVVERIELELIAAIDDDDALLERAAEVVLIETGARGEADVQEAHAIARALIAERDRVESEWTERTPNDGVDGAFAELDARGVVAIQRAGQTMSDGWTLADAAVEARGGARGAVFYHSQDLERALEGAGLLLAFAAYAPDEQLAEQSRAVGEEICETLTRHGLEVAWNGDLERRIRILPFEWKKRRRARRS